MPVTFALATKTEIEKALKKYYGVGAETLDEMGEGDAMDLEVATDKEITEGDQEASVIKFVNQIIWEAFKNRATDIHFEPQEDELRIRNRIDGILHLIPLPPQLKRFQSAHHFAHQGDERDEHFRKAAAAGRTHQRPHQGRGN